MHVVLFFLLLVAAIVGLAVTQAFLREMRSRHPGLWDELGEPSLWMNNSIHNSLAVLRFLWRKDYQTLGDPEFARRAEFLWTYQIAYLIFFGATIVWVLADSFSHATSHI